MARKVSRAHTEGKAQLWGGEFLSVYNICYLLYSNVLPIKNTYSYHAELDSASRKADIVDADPPVSQRFCPKEILPKGFLGGESRCGIT